MAGDGGEQRKADPSLRSEWQTLGMGVRAAGGMVRVRARVFLDTEFMEGAEEEAGEARRAEE
jgi:hypothetical protein